MNIDLENKIRKAYSSGLVYDFDEEVIKSEERDIRLRAVIDSCSMECNLECKITLWSDSRYYEIVMTQKSDPSFYSQWISQMTNEDKVKWVVSNNEPYPVFWLKVSRIDDYYTFYYNHWVPKADTGYIDAKCDIQPNQTWLGHEAHIKSKLEEFGFKYLTRELASEKISYVLEDEYISDDDPRWENDEFEPPLVPSDVYECLFSI